MSRRATALAFTLAATLAVGGLLAAAATDRRPAAFSIGVAGNEPVGSLGPGKALCQGPITIRAASDGLEAWLRPAGQVQAEIRTASGAFPATTRPVSKLTGATRVDFHRTLRRGSEATVCLRNVSTGRVGFEGGSASAQSGRLRGLPGSGGNALVLLFRRPDPPSLLNEIPTVFRRASLFKLSFVGAWTYWVLLAALVGSVGLIWLALATAEAEDARAAADDAPLF